MFLKSDGVEWVKRADELEKVRRLRQQSEVVEYEASEQASLFNRTEADHFMRMYGSLFHSLNETVTKLKAAAKQVATLQLKASNQLT